jgi:hypothetical protein
MGSGRWRCAHFFAPILLAVLLASAQPASGSSSHTAKAKANIVFLLTDDQDRQLGSMAALPSVEKYVTGRGVNVSNMFVNTPICCPSRSTLFSGRFNVRARVCSRVSWALQTAHAPCSIIYGVRARVCALVRACVRACHGPCRLLMRLAA